MACFAAPQRIRHHDSRNITGAHESQDGLSSETTEIGEPLSLLPELRCNNVAVSRNEKRRTNKKMERDLLNSWIFVVGPETAGGAAAQVASSSLQNCDDAHRDGHPEERASLGSGSFPYFNNTGGRDKIVRRRSFWTTIFLAVKQHTLAAAPMSWMWRRKTSLPLKTKPLPYHFHARSILTGQVAGDYNTVTISKCCGSSATVTASSSASTKAAPAGECHVPRPSSHRQVRTRRPAISTPRRNPEAIPVQTKNPKSQEVVKNLKSLGTFDFPPGSNNETPKVFQKPSPVADKKNIPVTSRSLGIFNFDFPWLITAPSPNANSRSTTTTGDNKSCTVVVAKPIVSQTQQRIHFWENLVRKQLGPPPSSSSSSSSVGTIEAMIELGIAYMSAGKYDQAVQTFQRVLDQFTDPVKPHHHINLRVARVMVGLGCSLSFQFPGSAGATNCSNKAMDYLNEAFMIRYQCLGPQHVDTVESLNEIASLHFRSGQLQEAREAYNQVFYLRKAIFGDHHPSVAVASHKLGQVCVRLLETERAADYYNYAKRIYMEHLQLPRTNPSVVSVLLDLEDLL